MRERLQARLVSLKAEFERGQKRLEELEAEANGVRTVMLRLSGAIQVLEEELSAAESPRDGHPAAPSATLHVPTDGADRTRHEPPSDRPIVRTAPAAGDTALIPGVHATADAAGSRSGGSGSGSTGGGGDAR